MTEQRRVRPSPGARDPKTVRAGRHARWAALAKLPLLAVLLGLALAGCEPREIVPTQPALLVRPERDQLAYRRLVLPNGLRVMLASNPQAEEAAASMSVGVGSLNDPAERAGLTHFLEHMLFLGTEKYPEPNAYTRFLSSHGGGSNAYTADDHTNYFFSVDSDAFEGALDRFAQFFVAPLFDQAYTDREMNAVDAEHAKNLENDHWRTRQVQRLQFDRTHPISRFSTGNLSTLRGVTRDELLGFYRAHYSANTMTLAVAGSRSLDELEALVRERFEAVENRNLTPAGYPPVYLAPRPALRLLRVVPVADQRTLSLHFPLPPVEQLYESRPLELISSILGHEGKGSLLSALKARGWAQSLSAGAGESTESYAALEISIALTPAGLDAYRDVLRMTLGAIAGLREQGIPREIFDEQRVLTEINYRYRAVPGSGSIARRLSAMMQRYPLDVLPDEPFLLRNYAPAQYAALLDRLRPDNMLVTLVASDLPTDDVERFYKARFGYEELGGEAYADLAAARPDAGWHLPEPNAFIPRDVVLHDPQGPLKLAVVTHRLLRAAGMPEALLARLEPLVGESFTSGEAYVARVQTVLAPEERGRWLPALLENALPLPVRLIDSDRARVWYQPDWRFRQPRAEIRLKFFVDAAYATPAQVMLGALYESAVEESLNEVGYPIRLAGLGYQVQDVKGGLLLSLSGYSARMLELLQFIVERMQRIEIDERTFASLKERQRRALQNQRLEQPFRQSQYFVRMLLERPNFTHESLEAALEPLTLDDLRGFARSALRRTFAEGVVVGNLRRADARAAIERALDTLGSDVLPPERRVDGEIAELPRSADWVYSQRLDVNNSLMQLLYMVGPADPALEAALGVISRPMSEGFYYQMRTQQQLGYIVWAGSGSMRRVLNVYFIVQSGQYPADELRSRMEAFIPGFIQAFQAMPEEAFEQYRTAVVQSKLERADGLGEIAQGLYWSAFRNDERFDYVSEQLEALDKLTREQVEDVLTRHLTGPDRRRLSIRLLGKDHDAGRPTGQPVTLPRAVRARAG